MAELSTENARREILFAVAQAYFGAASFQEAIRAAQFLLEVNTARESDTQKRFDAGTVTKVRERRLTVEPEPMGCVTFMCTSDAAGRRNAAIIAQRSSSVKQQTHRDAARPCRSRLTRSPSCPTT